MLQAYYKNGLVFLSEKIYGDIDPKHLKAIEYKANDDGFVTEHALDAPIEYLGGKNVSRNLDTDSLNKMLKKTGYSAAMNMKGKPADLFLSFKEKGVCSKCGNSGPVKGNVATIFPLESEWGKSGLFLLPPERRLRFCKRCAFLIYSGMAGSLRTHYKKKNLRIIFDADPGSLLSILSRFKGMDRDENDLNNVELSRPTPYDAHEMLLFLIYRFIKLSLKPSEENSSDIFSESRSESANMTKGGLWGSSDLNQRTDLKQEDYNSVLRKANMYYVFSGDKMRDDVGVVEGEVLFGLSKFFAALEKEAEKLEPDEMGRSPSPFEAFMYTSISIGGKDRSDKNLKKIKIGNSGNKVLIKHRDEFCAGLLNKKVDFGTICEITFKRKKLGERRPVPAYYNMIVTKYLEGFGMKEELDKFRRLNAFGYDLGRNVKGTNLESFVWEIYRARGFEDLLNALSELQLKLGTKQNWTHLYESKDNWKTAKAIILNGMMNAIADNEEVKKDGLE